MNNTAFPYGPGFPNGTFHGASWNPWWGTNPNWNGGHPNNSWNGGWNGGWNNGGNTHWNNTFQNGFQAGFLAAFQWFCTNANWNTNANGFANGNWNGATGWNPNGNSNGNPGWNPNWNSNWNPNWNMNWNPNWTNGTGFGHYGQPTNGNVPTSTGTGNPTDCTTPNFARNAA